MFSIRLHVPPEGEDRLIADLADQGTTGIIEEPGGLRAFFEESSDQAALLARFAEFTPQVRSEAPTDWAQVSRDAFPPLALGERFYLVAPWHPDEPPPDGRLRLEVTPGMALGTGRHPATQLCLRAIERYVRPGACVLDVGTGSGILARAAFLMGAGRVMGCDTDPESVGVARANPGAPPIFIGSIDAVASGWADVIVANIDAPTLELLAPELERVRKPESVLILSGFPVGDTPAGLRPKEVFRQQERQQDLIEEWLCWIL